MYTVWVLPAGSKEKIEEEEETAKGHQGLQEKGEEEEKEDDPMVEAPANTENPDQMETLEMQMESYDSYWRLQQDEEEARQAQEELAATWW